MRDYLRCSKGRLRFRFGLFWEEEDERPLKKQFGDSYIYIYTYHLHLFLVYIYIYQFNYCFPLFGPCLLVFNP